MSIMTVHDRLEPNRNPVFVIGGSRQKRQPFFALHQREPP
ncbi:hypothetical protein MICA_2442 [Micavibrio aeruginosavorus ARL-13]|uniref:Uncharacterized protein n=1 Tax=Micavibrio aeruginosavorus (strain ARL-13) TaxID=856793 RepID=G2KNU9_MICAA|nr:hypothetical protein MICA_2442 [Micavibrio aeruginosavorus ARL-13]